MARTTPKMAHRHGVAVYLAGGPMADLIRREVRDDLVAEQVEVDPVAGAAPFRAAEQAAVEAVGSR